jgi:hypothetical protein
MSGLYRHTQIGTVVLVPLAIPTVGVLVAVTAGAPRVPMLALAGVFVFLMLLLGSLTVTVDHAVVALRFGVGLIQHRLALSDIRTVRTVRNRWYYGWGIRLLPRGWLYNVSGLDAVEIELADGRAHRIGTDEPETLAAAIEQARGVAG